jgi:hypothetical protein
MPILMLLIGSHCTSHRENKIMDLQLFNDVITGNKPIDMLSDKELAETTHDIDTVRNMLMEELTKRVPKYDVNTGTQILKLLLYAMSGEKNEDECLDKC